MMKMMINNCFVVPTQDKCSYFFYAPLKGAFFKFDSELLPEVEGFLRGEPISEKNQSLKKNLDYVFSKPDLKYRTRATSFPNHMLFLLTERCNLQCAYCYAHDSHCKDTLTTEDLKTLIDYLYSFECKTKRRSISFLGGGEPTLTWKLIVWVVEYCKQKAEERDEKVDFGITTNMTLLTEDMMKYIKANKIAINASFDVLPDIQNSQRQFANKMGSFEIVDKNIKALINAGRVPHIRATITPLNVKRMPEMVKFISENYPKIKKVHFEHVSDSNLEDGNTYFDNFIEYYFEALKIAKQTGINLTNSVVNSIKHLRKFYCSQEFCVTANKDIVSCHRVSNQNSDLFKNFCYGKLTGKDVVLDKDLERETLQLPHECENCFAKYNCAGGCRYNRHILSQEQFNSYCSFVKKMITRLFDELLSTN